MSYPGDMTAKHLGAAGQQVSYEPQRNNNAILIVTGIGGGVDDNVLQLSLKSFNGPEISNDVKMAGYLNEKRKFAGTPSFGDMDIVLRDMVDTKTATMILNWRSQVYNPATGAIGMKKNYAKFGQILMFGPDGGYKRVYDLQGLWPATYSHDRFDMDSDELVNISVRLCVDKWIPGDGITGSASTSGSIQTSVNSAFQNL